jgi:hypothetical protein
LWFNKVKSTIKLVEQRSYLMVVRFILSDYVEQAIAQAVYDKLEDGTFAFENSRM